MEEQDAAVRALIVRLAENKSALGRRYAEWGASAALPASAVAITDMALDEHNHATVLYTLIDGGVQRDAASIAAYVAPAPTPFLRSAWRSWLDLIAANFLFDSAMSIILTAAIESRDESLASVARAILQEEQPHAAYGDGWVRRLGSEGGPMAQGIAVSLRRIWNEVFCWLGPQHDPAAEALYSGKILDAMPNVLRARLLSQVGPAITTARLDLPVRSPQRGNVWEFTEPLPWEHWDTLHWRLDLPEAESPEEPS
jgi:1,2-phenylacetyl-CoA epoxidase catalytic subunit